MKKFFFIICLSYFIPSIAQTTIFEEKYVKGSKPISFHYFQDPQKIVIERGKSMGLLIASLKTTAIYSYDFSGNKTTIIENANLYSNDFSPSGKVFRLHDISTSVFKPVEMYVIDNKLSKTYSMVEADPFAKLFPHYRNFNDKYTFKLINQKNSQKIDYQNDILRILKVDNITRKRKFVKFTKPNVDRLITSNHVQPEKKLGLNINLKDDNIVFITKSITSDYATTTLYQTTYSSINDSLVSDIPFVVNLKDDKKLIYSNNNGGFTETYPNPKTLPFFNDDLFINNFITDSKTGDVYIYGLYGDKKYKLNDNAHPKGYYVFKFDKKGNKIWESLNAIDDKKFSREHYMYFTETRLRFINNKLCFYAFINEHAEYVNYGILDKETGVEEKANKVVFHEILSSIKTGSEFFKLDYNIENVKELNGKRFDVEGIIAYDYFPKFAEYVRSAKSKKNIHFSTHFSESCLLIMETDNNNYYKATYFKQ